MKLTKICMLLVLVLSWIAYADTCTDCFHTDAYLTVTNAKGISVLQQLMTCQFIGYVTGPSDLDPVTGLPRCHSGHDSSVPGVTVPGVIGDNGEVSAGNMSNFSCNFTFPKVFTVEGDWNATVKFNQSYGFMPYSSYISSDTPADVDSWYPSWSGDCTGPGDPTTRSNCYQDQNYLCQSGIYSGSYEFVNFTLYTINYNQNRADCLGNLSDWFPALDSPIPSGCTASNCCCGPHGDSDTFSYYNHTVPETCHWCYKGSHGTATTSTRNCPEATCTSKTGGWNNTVCANVTAKSDPPSDTSDTYCSGDKIRFMCNYTDGDGRIIGRDTQDQVATVTIFIDDGAGNYIPHNNTGGGPYGKDVKYSDDGYYYNDTTDLSEGVVHSWYCMASKTGYRTAVSPVSRINITSSSPTALSISVDKTSPYLGERVNVTANYTNAADHTALTDADCKLAINSEQFNLYQATYDESTKKYNVTTNELMPGPNDLDYTCKKACFKTATAHTTVYVRWAGELNFPSITIEDPTYSINSGGVYHKIIKKAPPGFTGNLTTDLGYGNSGFNWTYAMVVKPSKMIPACADINAIVDRSKILLVSNSSLIANTSSCPNITAFSGVIFQDAACVTNGAYCQINLTTLNVPYLLNFTINATYPTPIYNLLPNLTYTLLNGEKHLVQDVSKLRQFYFNGYYLESTQAPSFLMRLYGRIGPSPYGIYSFVDIIAFNQTRSSVDYNYFNNTNNAKVRVKGMPNCENLSVCTDDGMGHFTLDNDITAFNASGAYTHITNIAAEKLTVNPAGSECVTNDDCSSRPNVTSCPTAYCSSPGYQACQYVPPTANCTNRICDQLTLKCTSCDASANCPSQLSCTTCAPDKYCNVTSSTTAICTTCPYGWKNCDGHATCDVNILDSDPQHCGSCSPCTTGYTCSFGVCIIFPTCVLDGSCNYPSENYYNCPQDCCNADCTGKTSPSGGTDGYCHTTCSGRNGCGTVVSYCDGVMPGDKECSGFSTYATCCYGTSPGTCAPVACCTSCSASCKVGGRCLGC